LIQAELRPQGPYSLRLSARLASDATRTFRDGVLDSVLAIDDRLERTSAWQRPDGAVCVRAESDAGVERMRFVLGLDSDHTEFLRRFAGDPLVGEATRQLRGLRPVRVATVAQALLRAVAGQLILASRAREIERAVIRAASPARGRAQPSSASAARSTSSRSAACPGPPSRRGSGASAGSAPGRSASSSSRVSAASSAASRATSGS